MSEDTEEYAIEFFWKMHSAIGWKSETQIGQRSFTLGHCL